MSRQCPIASVALTAPGRVALQTAGRRWSYAQLDAWTARYAQALAGRGVEAGARVAILSTNREELVPLLFALWRLGAVAVMLNARLTAAELAAQVETARPSLKIAEASLADRVEGAVALESLEAEHLPPLPTPSAADAPAAILFTSGTTGKAKAAVLTWENFAAAARASAANIGGGAEDAWLLCLPLFHIGGLSMLVRAAIYGCRLVLQPRFDSREVVRAFDQDRITHASLVAVGLQRLVDERGATPFPEGIRAVLVGGGPVSAELLARARSLRLPVLQTYGLTEACAQVTTEVPSEADGTTAGVPLPGNELRIVDGEGVSLPPGAIGEIELRGPTVMAGYFGDESETHQTLWKGWLRTRDLGTLDARGRLRVFSRRTDLLVSGGENVYPAEIEAVLLTLPGVREAAVIGVEDARWGQVPLAIVAAAEPLDPEELAAACRQRLAGYKIPHRFLQVVELPRNAMGKVDRRALRLLATPISGF
ncbi:MAG: o-succinylbenzoate--CoA ligase [Myxococcota bacterium]|nr:o-succinylbenzoate--CoA ligase [Myxococcota bacterium]